MGDGGLRAVMIPVVEQALEDAGADDPAAPHQHGARRPAELLVDVLVRLVGVDDPVGMIRVLRAELLEVGQELEPRVAECEVHVGGAVGDPLGLRGAHGRVQDREVAPAVAAAHRADPGRSCRSS